MGGERKTFVSGPTSPVEARHRVALFPSGSEWSAQEQHNNSTLSSCSARIFQAFFFFFFSYGQVILKLVIFVAQTCPWRHSQSL